MALSDAERRAVMDALRAQLAERPITTTDRDFWTKHGLPTISERLDIIRRAATLAEAAAHLEVNDVTGTLADLFGGSGYDVSSVEGGPGDSARPRIYARVAFHKGGRIRYASIAASYSWDTTVDEAMSHLQEIIDDLEQRYNAGEGEIVPDSLIIS